MHASIHYQPTMAAACTWPDWVQANEVSEFVKSLKAVPKTGLHNPLKNPER